jgi:hypothetical protein
LGNYNQAQHQIVAANVVQTAMYCSSIIALNLTMQSLYLPNNKLLSQAALYHLNKAVVRLRECLQTSTNCTSDITLATIFPLAVVHVCSWNNHPY